MHHAMTFVWAKINTFYCSSRRRRQIHRRDDGWGVGVDQLQDLCAARTAGEVGATWPDRHCAESRFISLDCQLQGCKYCKVS